MCSTEKRVYQKCSLKTLNIFILVNNNNFPSEVLVNLLIHLICVKTALRKVGYPPFFYMLNK